MLSFDDTHLAARINLLTLIILGEGSCSSPSLRYHKLNVAKYVYFCRNIKLSNVVVRIEKNMGWNLWDKTTSRAGSPFYFFSA